MGVQLPEALGRMVAEKAEGNALFAEEIAGFLIERGLVRRTAVGPADVSARAQVVQGPTSSITSDTRLLCRFECLRCSRKSDWLRLKADVVQRFHKWQERALSGELLKSFGVRFE